MSTITREFTKEQLQQIIETDHVQCGEASALARIALASLEAEAVCVIDQSNLDYLKSGSDADVWPASRTEMGDVLLYRAAPPAPVSVPDEDLLHMAASAIEDLLSNKDRYCAGVWADIPAKLRRAAMLQGARNHPEDNLDMVDHSGDANEKGNSPVIPDGWVLVPVEPTEDMIVNGFESEPDESFSDEREWEAYDAMSGCQQAAHRARLCWAAMLAAAPRPEA